MDNSKQACEIGVGEHVAAFWNYLETETVRIQLDLRRTIGTDAPDGPIVYWDGSSFSEAVARAILAERADLINALREAQAALNGAPHTVGLDSQIATSLARKA